MPIEEGPDFGLFYTRTEFYDVIQRHRDTKDGKVCYDDNAADYIYRLSCGHPSVTVPLDNVIKLSHTKIIRNLALPQKALEKLDGDHQGCMVLGFDQSRHLYFHMKDRAIAEKLQRKALDVETVSRKSRQGQMVILYPLIENLYQAYVENIQNSLIVGDFPT
jgi:hypothetical protein